MPPATHRLEARCHELGHDLPVAPLSSGTEEETMDADAELTE